jgi:hypothetical protein
MTLHGGIAPCVDAGMLKCKKCERGAKYDKAHLPTCKESNAYKLKLKNNGRKLVSDKRGGQTNPFTRANGDAFFSPGSIQMVLVVLLLHKIQAQKYPQKNRQTHFLTICCLLKR